MKRQQIPQNLVNENFYVHEKILLARNCHRRFIKNFLLEKTQRKRKPNNRDSNRN